MEDGSCVLISLEGVGGLAIMSDVDCVTVSGCGDWVREPVGSVVDPVG